ncbi:uncharacterized protein IL334_007951 [Kwoniella shivajii]|uniref:AB hydrolase-1 domain-containing protein n=1 Tax=Kwoniella shivajii TaxID=564305 RepID=A0ABZ1DBH2_9TREE|nr:hypothetical protein IL334_007951 [Kwoniella shivajii]
MALSHHEYDSVTDALSDYHLILPDLHCDALDTTRGIDPFDISRAADLIPHLIRTKARNHHAHGVSLGAHAAIATAAKYGDVTRSIFISGYNSFQPPTWAKSVIPYLAHGVVKLEGVAGGSAAPTLKPVKQVDDVIFEQRTSGEAFNKGHIMERLFATAVLRWIEERPLPDGFEEC